jgi:molecular chaperone GrpE
MTAKKPSDNKNDNIQIKLKIIEKEVNELKKEIKEKNDKLLRVNADLLNYQKRIEKEINLRVEETKRKYILELIDLHEILQKAYNDKNPKEGLKLIINNIEKIIEKENIKYIDCIGKSFDHSLHHAVTIVEKNNCENDIIIEEVKKGYLIGDSLLRPSQVIVAKKKENE